MFTQYEFRVLQWQHCDKNKLAEEESARGKRSKQGDKVKIAVWVPEGLVSYYKVIVVGESVYTDPSESRSISQPLWAWHGLARILNPRPPPLPPLLASADTAVSFRTLCREIPSRQRRKSQEEQKAGA